MLTTQKFSPVEVVNQGLGFLFRAYTAGNWQDLSPDDIRRLRARAETLICMGHAILKKIDTLCQKK